MEILINTASNTTWMPLLDWIYNPISLADLRKLLQQISIFTTKKRDDHLYGATRYLANSLGIYICNTNASNLIDQPMTPVKKKPLWRSATFHCRCATYSAGFHSCHIRTFCKTCSFLVSQDDMSISRFICPFCLMNESWNNTGGHPCLACQFATIIYRNPFHL
jgi:hypothetical protein